MVTATPDAHNSARSLTIALCRRGPLTVDALAAFARLSDDGFRAAFLVVARELRVLGLGLVRLEREALLERVMGAGRDELRTLLSQIRRRAAEFELERDRLLLLLARQQLRPVVLKGSGSRGVIYAEPAERQTGDIDLLVRPEDLDRVVTTLLSSRYEALEDAAAAAYREKHFHLRFTHPLGYVVEVHWALGEPHRPSQLDAALFLEQTHALSRGPRGAMRIPRHELGLLHMVLQNVQDRFLWFNRLVDVDRFVAHTTLDWTYVEQQARAAGLEVALALTCDLARRILGTQFPADLLHRLQPPRSVRRHLALLDPELRIVEPLRTRRSAADRLLDVRLAPSASSAMRRFAYLLTVDGAVAPHHVALGHAVQPGLFRRFSTLAKVIAYQISLYQSGAMRSPLWDTAEDTPAGE